VALCIVTGMVISQVTVPVNKSRHFEKLPVR
jgi:hypothetical protein